MATNGGALQGIPQLPRGNLNCGPCGVLLDSMDSLNVHNMHYHSNELNRWSTPANTKSTPTTNTHTTSTTSHSPTDSDNNNHTKPRIQVTTAKNTTSPLHNTISAAADSSDNQPSTPQPPISGGTCNTDPRSAYVTYGINNDTNPPFHHQPPQPAELHYPPFMHSYEPFYHSGVDFGMPPHFINNPAAPPPTSQHVTDYKTVPLSRYQPYSISHNLNQANVINSSLSPRVVSSSSPTQNNLMQSTTNIVSPAHINQSQQHPPPGQPTPSP